MVVSVQFTCWKENRLQFTKLSIRGIRFFFRDYGFFFLEENLKFVPIEFHCYSNGSNSANYALNNQTTGTRVNVSCCR